MKAVKMLAIEALANNCELFLSDTSSHHDFIPTGNS